MICTIEAAGRSYRIHDPGGRVGAKVSRGEPYERKLLTDIRQRHHRGTAVDVGAHVGNHSLYLAAICGLSVVAFEPRPEPYAALCANRDLNPGITIFAINAALGATDCTGSIGPGMTVIPGEGDVEIRRFDDHYTVDDLSVVKVDVEGAEASVLAGMVEHLERCRPTVYVEAHTPEAEESHRAVLEPLGYELTKRIATASPMHRWEHP